MLYYLLIYELISVKIQSLSILINVLKTFLENVSSLQFADTKFVHNETFVYFFSENYCLVVYQVCLPWCSFNSQLFNWTQAWAINNHSQI